jgi:23S rRNA pseudouridine1911/1915/1917 synthase
MLEDKSLAEARRAHVRPKPALPIEKTYLAITWGTPQGGLIDLPLEPDPDNPLRVKMIVARPGTGLEARTEVTVLQRTERYALVACRLLTGRQHQIRVHLSAVGCPVVGDKLYGPDERMLARSADRELTAEDLVRLELPRQALHAHRLLLPHAISGAMLDLVSPLPPDLSEFWAAKTGRAHTEVQSAQGTFAPDVRADAGRNG